jgi:hypothetical protein
VEVCEGVVECGGPGVEPRGLHKILYDQIAKIGCHVAALDWATWHPIIRPKMPRVKYNSPTIDQSKLCHVSTYHIIHDVPSWTSVVRGHTDIRTGIVSIPNFCLFGSMNRSRYLLHTDSVCESKYTAGIRRTRRTQWHHFRRILSTLKIEQILDPWSRF